MTVLIRELLDLAKSWWTVDRIRVSPREGQLLRLEAGDLVRVENRVFDVVEKDVRSENGVRFVQYSCIGIGGEAGRLFIPFHRMDAKQQVRFDGDGGTRFVLFDDIESFPRHDPGGKHFGNFRGQSIED